MLYQRYVAAATAATPCQHTRFLRNALHLSQLASIFDISSISHIAMAYAASFVPHGANNDMRDKRLEAWDVRHKGAGRSRSRHDRSRGTYAGRDCSWIDCPLDNGPVHRPRVAVCASVSAWSQRRVRLVPAVRRHNILCQRRSSVLLVSRTGKVF